MKMLHAQQQFRGEVTLPPFTTLMIFDADEMELVEILVAVLLKMKLPDEERQKLVSIYEQVRMPKDSTEVH